jgi:hypothetical protein
MPLGGDAASARFREDRRGIKLMVDPCRTTPRPIIHGQGSPRRACSKRRWRR